MSRKPDVALLFGVGEAVPEVLVSGRHDVDAFVEIGSVTKTFTAALLHVMAEEGLVGMDDRVADLLRLRSDPGISLRHLAEHTSGLPRLPPGVRVWSRDPYAGFDADAFGKVLRDLPALAGGEPGLVVDYSNLGYAVLGAALSTAAGTPWVEAVRRHVVERLDLPEVAVLEPDVPRDRRLVAVGRRGRPRPTWTLGPMAPAGGLWTTPRALAHYTRKVLLDRALGTLPVGWQHTDGITWHNGATRDAQVFVGAAPSGRWSVCHGLRRPVAETDAMGVRALQDPA